MRAIRALQGAGATGGRTRRRAKACLARLAVRVPGGVVARSRHQLFSSSALSEVPSVEVPGEQDQGDVDRWQVAGEPARQVDVGDRAALGADTLCDLGKG